MKKISAITIVYMVFFNMASAQMNPDLLPQSARFSRTLFSTLPEIILPGFSNEEIAALDYNDSKNGSLPKFARNLSINVKLNNSGIWTNLPNGDRIWRIQITSKGALGLLPMFDSLYLPEGTLLHVYMPGKEELLGAFTHDNTPELRSFSTGIIHGETCIIEYYEPLVQKGAGVLSINKIGHAYRWVKALANTLDDKAGACEVNVVCPEGSDWQDQVRSSVRILIYSDSGEGYCSGSLINNARNDCTPYILSAQHCTEGSVSPYQFSQWVFLFNNYSSTCNGTTCPTSDMVNGCTKIADSEDNGGARGSDFLLLKLNSIPPASYHVYYSGWDNSPSSPASSVCIHHPKGDCTKISTCTNSLTSASWGDTAKDTHWIAHWSSTASGYGVTEPGSSGAALYNPQKLIVAHLTGGNSCCEVNACGFSSSPDAPDFFGKIAYDWNLDGINPTLQLQPWLDPDNTGVSSIPGMYPPCGSGILNDAGIQTISVPNGDICSQDFAPSITLRNFGGNTLNSVTLNYVVDQGFLNQFSWTGSLIPGGSLAIPLPGMALVTGNHTFTISTSNPNHHADGNSSNDFMSSSFYISPPAAALVLNLSTDNFGSQTTWEIADSLSNTILSGGPYSNYVGGQQFQIPICLQPGCYTFNIFDAAGDGMTFGRNGNFQITGPGGSPVYASLNSASFGTQESHTFCLQVSGISEIGTSYLSVIPNPSTGVFNIGFDNGEQKSIQVYDVLGRVILEKEFHDKNMAIDLSSFGKGVYILKTETKDGKNTQKLVLD